MSPRPCTRLAAVLYLVLFLTLTVALAPAAWADEDFDDASIGDGPYRLVQIAGSGARIGG